ncbi:MAG: type sorting protein, partial [Myxococcaceae bacterium]|nr:type sorting protein [Myxococcaceae bacterium]
ALPPGYDGATVDLCRDRACVTVLETIPARGTSARPTADLPGGAVVFWRLRGRVGAATDTATGPVWLFHVPARSASGGVDASFNAHLDVNGDGFDDVVVGAEQPDLGGRDNPGVVRVYLGSAAGLAASESRYLPGAVAGDRFGHAVSGAGDLDGDGYADLVVGAPDASPAGRTRAGTASVYLGGESGLAATPAVVLAGDAPGDSFGTAVAGAGDVNGDGYGDLVVGASRASAGGRHLAGAASVFHGGASGVAAVAARVIEGDAVGDLLGERVAGAGDVNGDGYGDLVVGAYNANRGADPVRGTTGAASVFQGSAEGIPSTPAAVYEGVAAADQFGASVGSAGDVNGDGYGDVVVGASTGSRAGGVRAGTASVFHGSAAGLAATAAVVFWGAARNDYFGSAAAGAGDVDGDGYGDLVIGAYLASPGARASAGTASVFHGSAAGLAATATEVLEGRFALDRFGHAVSGAGDVDGDGHGDLVIGAYNAVAGALGRVGTVSVFRGSKSGLAAPAATVLTGRNVGDAFGYAVGG